MLKKLKRDIMGPGVALMLAAIQIFGSVAKAERTTAPAPTILTMNDTAFPPFAALDGGAVVKPINRDAKPAHGAKVSAAIPSFTDKSIGPKPHTSGKITKDFKRNEIPSNGNPTLVTMPKFGIGDLSLYGGLGRTYTPKAQGASAGFGHEINGGVKMNFAEAFDTKFGIKVGGVYADIGGITKNWTQISQLPVGPTTNLVTSKINTRTGYSITGATVSLSATTLEMLEVSVGGGYGCETMQTATNTQNNVKTAYKGQVIATTNVAQNRNYKARSCSPIGTGAVALDVAKAARKMFHAPLPEQLGLTVGIDGLVGNFATPAANGHGPSRMSGVVGAKFLVSWTHNF